MPILIYVFTFILSLDKKSNDTQEEKCGIDVSYGAIEPSSSKIKVSTRIKNFHFWVKCGVLSYHFISARILIRSFRNLEALLNMVKRPCVAKI